MLLYADLFEQETTWAHIKASEALMEVYESPCAVMLIRYECFASSREEIAFGESIFCKLMKLTLNGDR